jgi:predicted Zn-dependent protease
VVLSESDAVNAFADGEKVVITKGMMRFVENDRELSLVIAHEMAHNAMGHTDNKLGLPFTHKSR